MNDKAISSRPQRGLWNSPVLTALVTGTFGVLTAGIGYLAVIREPSPEPTSARGFVDTEQPAPPVGAPPAAAATVGTSEVSPSVPNMLLNFAAFQSLMASPEIKRQERDLMIRPLLHHKVIWKGYVDQITPAAQPTSDLAVTVSLVETAGKMGQSMFKMPAHCRFGPEAVDQVAELAPGDLVTITGTFSDHSLIGTNITAAHLMSINGRPLSRMASGPTNGALTR